MNEETLNAIRQYGLDVVATSTNPTRPGKQPKPVWNISGVNLSRYEHILRDQMGLKKWRGHFSAWSDPCEELLQLLQSEDKMTVEEAHQYQAGRSLERAERLEQRAGKHQQTGAALLGQADQISRRFHMGQPILVGHHSEKGARQDQERMWNKTERGVGEQRYASHLSERAAAAERHSERKSEYTLEYVGNRIKETESTLASVRRELSIQVSSEVTVPDGRKGTVYWLGKGKDKGKAKVEFSNLPDQEPEWGEFKVEELTLVLNENYHTQLQLKQQNAEEDLAFWQQKYEKLGGSRYSPEKIKVGDYIRYWGGWTEVVRVNSKSVTVKTQWSWTQTVEYHKLTDHVTAEDWQAKQQQQKAQQ
jgi:hypothetical protein